MARPLEFDLEKARDKALLLFWQKGYQATSLPNLLVAMGISRSSFYAAFSDKRTLFVACLGLFAQRTQQVLLKAESDKPPLDALQISHDSPSGNIGFSVCFSLFISPFIAPAQRAEASLDLHYSESGVAHSLVK